MTDRRPVAEHEAAPFPVIARMDDKPVEAAEIVTLNSAAKFGLANL